MNAQQRSPTVACPRCGYDQRGVIATWNDTCPLQAICTECGLQWQWAESLNPNLRKPAWCVEYAPTVWSLLWRCERTLLVTFNPWKFWRTLKMTHEPRWSRILAYLLFWLAAVYLAFAVAQASIARNAWHSNQMLGMTPSVTEMQAAAHAFFMPLSSRSAGTYIAPNGAAIAFASPLKQVEAYWWDTAINVGSFALGHLICGLAFALLPQSRRVAKVKWSHIVRITLYGAGLFIPAALMHTFAFALAGLINFLVLANIAAVVFLLIVPLMFLWWSLATSRYLKMQHPWGVGAAVFMIAALIVTLIETLRFLIHHDALWL